MKRWLARVLLASVSAATLPYAAADNQAGLQVDVVGVRSAKGDIIATLCRDGEVFPDKCTRSASAHAQAGVVALQFPTLPPGTYALALYHDENANQKLEFIREGIGFSNNANLAFAPPNFRLSAFKVEGSTRIRVNMKYYQ